MNGFTITESADGNFILKVSGRYFCRCDSYDEAIQAYENYLLVQEAENQSC